MYQDKLLDAYKKAKNYVQDKQIAHDLDLDGPKISKIRKGVRQLSDKEAIFLAQGANIDPELALLGCHADRNENPMIKNMWESIAKKLNSQGLQRLSMACGGLAMWVGTPKEAMAQCALCILC
ncbi:DUF3693 domain-containing protein [Aliivibrio fischeri]|uniref:DUF3693 domain-containing protein n=1 Tax=Aliivibrio fischeri TaxID=668 RepID=UPI00373641BC